MGFGITRNDLPIEDHDLINTVKTGINYNASFEHWEAIIASGGGPDDLLRYEEGLFPKWFVARMIAYNRGSVLVEGNRNDAVARKMKKDSKKKK